ncbi:MAG: formyl transferase [Nitrospiraceae bacterium]|nr:formyl transferase [Nitrospiraceae bacterium]
MRIVLFTRTGFHHTYFINRLQERFDVSCVVREGYPQTKKDGALASLMKYVLRKGRSGEKGDEAFLRDFGDKYSAGFRFHKMLKDYLMSPFDLVVERPGVKYVNVQCGDINSSGFASFLRELKPDIITVLGSSVISPEIISVPARAMINIHSGLSPYYRGTWSYGWPIVNNEPEYIGATVHYIDPGIDTGDIIFQTRPSLEPGDDLNAIFLKVISQGVELAAEAMERIIAESVQMYPQPRNAGRLYLTKDFNAAAARLCLSRLEGGIIAGYFSRKDEADAAIPLYGYVSPRILG